MRMKKLQCPVSYQPIDSLRTIAQLNGPETSIVAICTLSSFVARPDKFCYEDERDLTSIRTDVRAKDVKICRYPEGSIGYGCHGLAYEGLLHGCNKGSWIVKKNTMVSNSSRSSAEITSEQSSGF